MENIYRLEKNEKKINCAAFLNEYRWSNLSTGKSSNWKALCSNWLFNERTTYHIFSVKKKYKRRVVELLIDSHVSASVLFSRTRKWRTLRTSLSCLFNNRCIYTSDSNYYPVSDPFALYTVIMYISYRWLVGTYTRTYNTRALALKESQFDANAYANRETFS